MNRFCHDVSNSLIAQHSILNEDLSSPPKQNPITSILFNDSYSKSLILSDENQFHTKSFLLFLDLFYDQI
jgi:hypothetical protein